MKNRKIIALIMTLMMVFSVFGGTSSVFAEGGEGGSEPAEFLSEFSAASSSAASAAKYEITPAFSPAVHDYTITTADSTGSFYVWAKLSEAAAGGSITAKWKWYTTGADKTTAITSGNTTGVSLGNLQQAGGASGKTFVLEVTKGEDTQKYNFTTKSIRTLTGINVKDGAKKLKVTPEFSADTKDYSANVAGNTDSVTVYPVMRDGYKTSVDGKTLEGTSSEVQLGAGASKEISIKTEYPSEDSNEAGTAGEYKLTVNKVSTVKVKFNVTPADAIVVVEDSMGNKLKANDQGEYSVLPGDECTYTVTKYGYVGQSDTITQSENITKDITLGAAAENPAIDKTIKSQWKNFRNSDDNMGITDAKTPNSKKTANLKWAKKYGTSWAAAPCIQIIVKGKVFTIVGTKIYQLDPETGEVENEGALVGSTNFGYTPMTYAKGLIFCPLANGTVQAVNADTLESVWVYQDPLKGQSLSPITYKDGYIYTGFWNSETKDANYVCLSVTDEDPGTTNEAKTATWRHKQAGGFYWAGAAAIGDTLVFGTDDGTSKADSPTSSLYSVDRFTGEIISELNITGDQRSTISYDKQSGRIYGTTKGGYLFSAAIEESTGVLSDLKQVDYKAQSTSTPVVYKGKVYFATGSGISTTGSSGNLVVADADSLEMLYAVGLKGYPQSSVLLSTAYEEETGYIYIYSTYNNKPGGISMIKTKADNTQASGAELIELFDAKGYEQFCITSIICGEDGTLYYKNDSCNIFAVETNKAYIEDMEITGGNPAFSDEFATGTPEYDVAVDPGTASVKLTLELAAGATAEVNGEDLPVSGEKTITLEEGTATAVIKVDNGDDTRTYTVNLREKSQDAAASVINVNESNGYSSFKTLTPSFDPDTADYVAYGVSSSRSFINIWPKANNNKAKVKVYAVSGVDKDEISNPETGEIDVTATNSGNNRYAVYYGTDEKTVVVRVEIAAEDGKTVRNYNVAMTKRAAADKEGFYADLLKADNTDSDWILPFISDDSESKALFNELCGDAVAGYKVDGDYSGYDKDKFEYIKSSTAKKLALADSNEEALMLLEDAKAQIDMLEAEASLKKAKAEAKDTISSYADKAGEYRLNEKILLLAEIISSNKAVDAAGTADAVQEALDEATEALDAIKTDGDYKTDAMKTAKISLTAKASSYNSVKLSWNTVGEAEGYVVSRATSQAGKYTNVKTLSSTSYTDTKLATGTTYYYKVKACVAVDEDTVYSNDSAAKAIKPVLSKPANVKAKAGTKKVTVSWKKVDGASGYVVYRAVKSSGKYTAIKTITKPSTLKLTNSKLKKGKTYYYKVKAYRTVGGKNVHSDYSKAAKAKVK